MNTPVEKTSRGRFGFRLRTIMLLILVVGALLAWRVNRANTQRKVVSQILEARGSITYDFQVSPLGTLKSPSKPPGPEWLRRWLGDEYFQEVAEIWLRQPVNAELMAAVGQLDRLEAITINLPLKSGSGLEHLRGFARLKTIRLSGSAITDEWLANLKTSRDLENLQLNGAEISDAGLAQLTGLSKLRSLVVIGSPKVTDATALNVIPTLPSLVMLQIDGLTDRSMPTIGRISTLKTLALSNSRVTDSGINSLKGLTSLSVLHLSKTAITDEGLASLSEMVNLQQLDLSETRVTGSGFERLANLQKLGRLNLNGSDFSDEGMPLVAKLNGLRTLHLEQTRVTDGGLTPLETRPGRLTIYLGSTKVTSTAVVNLQQKNPQIKIMSNWTNRQL